MTLADVLADESTWMGLFRLLLGAGVLGGVGLLWKITLNTSLMARAFKDHEKRLIKVEDWKEEAKPQLHTLYRYHRSKRQDNSPETASE